MSKLQERVKAILEANDVFNELQTAAAIITENVKDVNGEIERALAELTCGVAIIIMTPSAESTHPNIPGPQYDNVMLYVHAVENTLVNRETTGTQKTASYWIEQAAAALHRQTGIQNQILVAGKINLLADEDKLVYRLTVKTSFGLAV
jgi:hypothetical protein